MSRKAVKNLITIVVALALCLHGLPGASFIFVQAAEGAEGEKTEEGTTGDTAEEGSAEATEGIKESTEEAATAEEVAEEAVAAEGVAEEENAEEVAEEAATTEGIAEEAATAEESTEEATAEKSIEGAATAEESAEDASGHEEPLQEILYEETPVEVAATVEEAAELAPMGEGEAFFSIDVSSGEVEGEKEFADLSDEGLSFTEIVEDTESIEERKETVVSFLEENILFEANAAEADKVEVTSVFSTCRVILLAEQAETVQTFGAKSAVYYDDRYILAYSSEEEAAYAYENLLLEYGEENVLIDYPVCLAAEGWGYTYINTAEGVKKATNGNPVVVAVLDSGINRNHSVFSNTQILSGTDFANRDSDPADDYGHGTAVAGIIAETTPSNVSILPIKITKNNGAVVSLDGSGLPSDVRSPSSLETVLQGMQYAVQNGADLINISIAGSAKGAKSTFDYYNSKIEQLDIPIICAAGNDGVDLDAGVYFPAACSSTIAVGAIDQSGRSGSFSNYGSSLDFSAPGVSVKVAHSTSGSGYKTIDGTSFSAPYVSAIAAMILAQHPSYTRDQLYKELQDMCLDLGAPGFDPYYGNGCPFFSPFPITQTQIAVSGSYTYTGSAIRPAVTVKHSGSTLKEGTEYTLSYKNNVNAGTATVTVTGKGNYTGSVAKTFSIAQKNISALSVSGINASYAYTGKAIKPVVTVKDGTRVLKAGTDYTITHKNNTNMGTGSVTIAMKGNYKGSTTRTFKIIANGWVGNRYYTNNVMSKGQKKIGGYWYMFDNNGNKVTGWYQHTSATNPKGGAKICYYDAKGHMLYNQQKISGYWYMFHPSSGALITGWYTHTAKTNPKGGAKTVYYLPTGTMGKGKGRMLYGQQKISGYWYMFHPGSGAMQTGWYNHTKATNPKGGAKRVYYNPGGSVGKGKGRMLYGRQKISGKWYTFDKGSGKLIS